MNRGGMMSEGINMIYRLFMVSFVAFIIFGAGSFVYDYHIDVRDAEARILTREIVNCLVGSGVLNLDDMTDRDKEEIVSYCDISHNDRFYVKVDVFDSFGERVERLEEGDSGTIWVKDLFESVGSVTGSVIAGDAAESLDKIIKYNPGYFSVEYPILFLKKGKKNEGKIKLEILVNYDEE